MNKIYYRFLGVGKTFVVVAGTVEVPTETTLDVICACVCTEVLFGCSVPIGRNGFPRPGEAV
jgi:hypothetical protein